jgi:hypothetical protein
MSMTNTISPEQLAANRANSQHSTGPRTPEGRARSSQNACKHGFTASTFSVIRLEDLDEIANLKSDLVSVYQPVNSQELFALERIAIAQQTILRAARLESGLFATCFNDGLDSLGQLIPVPQDLAQGIEVTRAQNRNYLVADGFHRMTRSSPSTWTLFLRYQAQAERNYRRAIEEFERLKALRPVLPNEPISTPDPEPAPEPEPDEAQPIQADPRSSAFIGDPHPEAPSSPNPDPATPHSDAILTDLCERKSQ